MSQQQPIDTELLQNSPNKEKKSDQRVVGVKRLACGERCPPSLLTVVKELCEEFALPSQPEIQGDEHGSRNIPQFIYILALLVTDEAHAATPKIVVDRIMSSSSSGTVIGALAQYLRSPRRSLDMYTVTNVLIVFSRIMHFGTRQHRDYMFVFAMPSIIRLLRYDEFIIDECKNAHMVLSCLFAVEKSSRRSVHRVLPAVANVLSRYTQRRILCHGSDTVISSCLEFLASCVKKHNETPRIVIDIENLKNNVVRDVLCLLKAPSSDLRLHASRSHDYVQRKALLANGDCIRGVLQYVPQGAKFNDVLFLCKDWFYDVVCDDACLYNRGQIKEVCMTLYGLNFLNEYMASARDQDFYSDDDDASEGSDYYDANGYPTVHGPRVNGTQIITSRWRDIHHDYEPNRNVAVINDILHLMRHPDSSICVGATRLLLAVCQDSGVARAVPTHVPLVDHMRRLLLHTDMAIVQQVVLQVIGTVTYMMTALDFRLCVERGLLYTVIPRTLHKITSVPEPDEGTVDAMADLLSVLACADIVTQPLVNARQRQRLINAEQSRWCVAGLDNLITFSPFYSMQQIRAVSVEEELSSVVMPDPESLSARGDGLLLPSDSDSFRSSLLAQFRFAICPSALVDMVGRMQSVIIMDWTMENLERFTDWVLTRSEQTALSL
eukprot:PhM_4_TR13285/c0_g1_i2/m.36397